MLRIRLQELMHMIYIMPLLILIVCVCACAPKKPTSFAPNADLLILHTNDIHAHIAGIDAQGNGCIKSADCRGGLARISKAIKDAKAQGANVLALDAGDMFTGTLFYSVHKSPMIAELNKLMPWDAATLGNHEWDEGCASLAKYLEHQPFPFLAANLKPIKGCPLLYSDTPPYIIREIGGAKVGVIGIANDEVVGLANACPQTKFTPRLETIEKQVHELERQGVNRIILLTHIGLPADRELARKLEGVDVIVGGHTHSYLGPNSQEGPYPIVERSPKGHPVLVVTAKRAGQYLGMLACNFDAEGILTSWQGEPHELAVTDPRDPQVEAKVAEYAESLDSYLGHKIGSHTLDLGPDGLDSCREHECVSGMLMADAMLAFGKPYGARVALLNSGGIRAALPPGDINQGHVLSTVPFGGKIVVRQYTGAQIWEALEHGVSGLKAQGPQMLQVAGLRYEVDPTKPAGHRVLKCYLVGQGNEQPLNLRARYRVVVPEYLVNGGDFFEVLTHGKKVAAPTPLDVDVLTSYFKAQSPIIKIISGRIVRK